MSRSVRVCWACLAASLLLAAGCQKTTPNTAAPSPATTESKPRTGRDVLQRMADAYQQAKSYVDWGTVRLLVEMKGGKPFEVPPAEFSVMMVRPDKIHVQVNQGVIVSDGQKWQAYVRTLPGQVVVRDAPTKVSLDTVYADQILSDALVQGFGGQIPNVILPAPQLVLLLANNALGKMLAGTEEVLLVESAKIKDRDCYRVQARWSQEGTATFWVDEKTYVLRRMEFPTSAIAQMLGGAAQVERMSLVADFVGAELNGPVDAKAFEFEIPPGSEQVKFFTAPNPYQLLGQKVPDFKFVDLQGKPFSPESLAGKVVVLDFWATACEPCRTSLPRLEEVYQKYKDNDKAVVLAVNVDPPEVENQALETAFKELKVNVPIVRDPEQHAGKLLKIAGIPTMMLLDADGKLQHCEMGENMELTTVLPERLTKLLARENLTTEALTQFQQRQKQAESRIDAAFLERIAEKSEPATFKLTSLWKSAELRSTGNLLVVPGEGQKPRLFVIDEWKAISEVSLGDGHVMATHRPEIQSEELICSLRSGVGKDGKRVFAGFTATQQRAHFFDENWKLLVSFPENALKNPHAGISDVQLGDLEGDGTLKAYVSYFGQVGVQGVSLEGKRLWSNRALTNVMRLALTGADPQGRRELVCSNESGTLAVLDPRGYLRTNVPIAQRTVDLIFTADLQGTGHPLWCGLGIRPGTDPFALGLDLQGRELWSYPLPKGEHRQPIEPVIAGRVTSKGPGQWLLPGCDGSIHILSDEGKRLDQFNYGSPLAGLAALELDGHPVLIISSENGLEALRIEQ